MCDNDYHCDASARGSIVVFFNAVDIDIVDALLFVTSSSILGISSGSRKGFETTSS